MDTLTGESAQDVRGDWWDVVHDRSIKRQRIVHVIRLDKPSDFIKGLRAYSIWKQGGATAVADALISLAEESEGWSYIVNALGAYVNHVRNFRILIAPQATLDDRDSTQRFWLDVYGSFFAGAVRETVWLLTEEEVLAEGYALLDYDDNEWGANGVMRTHYSQDGAVTARDYISRSDRECAGDLAYIETILKLARRIGRKLEAV